MLAVPRAHTPLGKLGWLSSPRRRTHRSSPPPRQHGRSPCHYSWAPRSWPVCAATRSPISTCSSSTLPCGWEPQRLPSRSTPCAAAGTSVWTSTVVPCSSRMSWVVRAPSALAESPGALSTSACARLGRWLADFSPNQVFPMAARETAWSRPVT